MRFWATGIFFCKFAVPPLTEDDVEVDCPAFAGAVPVVSVNGITSAQVGTLVTLTATVTGAGSSYDIKWFKNSVLFSTTTAPVVTTSYTKGVGIDTVTIKVVPASIGCYDSVTSSAHIVKDSIVWVTPLNVKSTWIIYPNPTQDVVHIDGVTGQASYKISNIIGSVLKVGTLTECKNIISLQTLPAGIFMLEIFGNDGQKQYSKIIKQ